MSLRLSVPRRGNAAAAAMCAGLVAANAAAWGWAWAEFAGRPLLLGTALLAYTFGLRHAVDADHIAAIDNATRKLIETGRPATGTGLFFSLGHATIVFFAVLAIALLSPALPTGWAALQPLAGRLGTAVSALSLFALATANSVILVSVCRRFSAFRRGEPPIDDETTRLLARRGLFGRLLRGLFRLVTRSWHLYPLGLLFGFGFDTATEIGLLAVSATQAVQGLPLTAVMVFPALFAAGMTMIDSLDGLLIAGIYRWARREPHRKLSYNLAVTSLSVVVAVAIGGVELLGLGAGDAPPSGYFWSGIAMLNSHFGAIGAATIGVFAAIWTVSLLVQRRSASPSSAAAATGNAPTPLGWSQSITD